MYQKIFKIFKLLSRKTNFGLNTVFCYWKTSASILERLYKGQIIFQDDFPSKYSINIFFIKYKTFLSTGLKLYVNFHVVFSSIVWVTRMYKQMIVNNIDSLREKELTFTMTKFTLFSCITLKCKYHDKVNCTELTKRNICIPNFPC